MDSFAQKVGNGIIMIDDIDHTFEKAPVETDMVIMDKPTEKIKPKYQVSVPELLGFFDGLNTIHGLVVVMCANDPLKFFDKNDHSFSALCRDQRINHIFEFETCDRKMIATIYKNIFGAMPDEEKIERIDNDYYAPCTIAKVFSSFYEKNGGKIENKQDMINMLLVDLANKTVRTNDKIIVEYSERYQRDHTSV